MAFLGNMEPFNAESSSTLYLYLNFLPNKHKL
jgi:hypothetical protein